MTTPRLLKLFALGAALFVSGSPAFAVLFTAEDKGFTVDLASTWVKVNPKDGEVLSLKRDGATMKISPVSGCRDYACIEAETDKALEFVKSKKFRVLENTYSGEIIKRTEFSTGDPLLSFNYSGAAVDFTTAYFLADGKAYYVGIKGVPYVEADLILSFIAPAAKPTDPSQGARPVKTMAEPLVTDIIPNHIIDDNLPEAAAVAPVQSAAAAEPKPQEMRPAALNQESGAGPKTGAPQIILLIGALYAFMLIAAFFLRIFIPGRKMPKASNPRSKYPVKGMRLYGSPDLFFKIHDNQGNSYVLNSGRWGSVLIGVGIVGAGLFCLLKIFVSYAYAHGLLVMHLAVFNTIVSVSSLLSVLGIVVFVTGLMLNLLFGSKFTFYNDKGALAFKCLSKGINPFREEYVFADAKSAVLFRLRRTRFTLRRTWTVYDNNGEIAVIKEASSAKALLRMLFGHLCGFLRADYEIRGRVDSKGALLSYRRVFTYFHAEVDKPEAIDSDIILTAAGIIFTRDRDKWHPWVN